MTRAVKIVLLSAVLPVLFFAAASIPVELIGCRARGLVVALIAMLGGLLGVAAMVKAVIDRARGKTNSFLWVVCALILVVPTAFLALFG